MITGGSLFTGAGGLDMAVNSVYGARTVWHCENDPAAARVLKHRYPGVPNLGDITEVDWNTVEPVDIICGGSPCQDVSSAGKRAGMRTGTRSGLWASMCDAIDIIRPSLVVWENVRGVLSAEADSGLEPCPGCVGDPDDGAVLRALGRVLADLADVGYDASWCGLRAADVGAPHGRFRVFVVAADAQGVGHERGGIARGRRDGSADGGDTAVDAAVSGLQRGSFRRVQSGVSGEGRSVAADAWGGGWDGRAPVEVGGPVRGTAAARDRPHTPADTGGERLGEHPGGSSPQETGPVSGDEPSGDRGSRTAVDWGPYLPAIKRWEHVLGRLVPPPTELAPKGGQRLSPRFVEFMMGLPDGWVTGVPGVTRNDQLKILGNGVVPQQAAAALRVLTAAVGCAA